MSPLRLVSGCSIALFAWCTPGVPCAWVGARAQESEQVDAPERAPEWLPVLGPADGFPWPTLCGGPDLVLRLTPAGDFLAWAHDGLPESSLWREQPLPLDEPPDLDHALIAAARFVPERVSGQPPVSARAQADALDYLVRVLLFGGDDADLDVVFERMRGHLRPADLDAIAAALRDGSATQRHRSVSMLISAPFRMARPVLTELALDAEQPQEERGRYVERLLYGAGRPALDDLEPLLHPDTAEGVLRRFLVAWQAFVEIDDLPRLEALARDGTRVAQEFALQVWARKERDPERRVTIFELALDSEPTFRQAAVAALAHGGRDVGVAERLLGLLDSADGELRQLAMRSLPGFVEPERLYEHYAERVAPAGSVRARSRWMLELVRLPVPEAKALAAAWLADGGWAEGSLGRTVCRNLYESDAVDPYLDRLLIREPMDRSLAIGLAVARAPHAEIAREYLRRVLDDASPMHQEQAVRALGAAGDLRDRQLLHGIATDFEFDASSRAAAVESMARWREAGSERLLLDMLLELPEEYEVAEALVRASVRHGGVTLREAALASAAEGPLHGDADEHLGLRLAALQSQAAAPRAEEAVALATLVLEAIRASESGGSVGDPRRLLADHPVVDAGARALAAALAAADRNQDRERDARDGETDGEDGAPVGTRARALLRGADLGGRSPGARLVAAAILADREPRAAAAWMRALAGEVGLEPSVALRARASWARAAMQIDRDHALASLDALLAEPADLRAFPWDLAWGLAAAGARGWVLPGDRLAEQRLLVEAAHAEGGDRAALLAPLVEGYTAPTQLLDASSFALDAGEAELALALAWRAADFAPVELEPRLRIAEAAAAQEAFALEASACRAILRLAPAGARASKVARERLAELAEYDAER